MPDDTGKMSARDREQLQKLMRFSAKVAKDAIRERAAAMVAELERQLSAVYQFDHDQWAEVTAEAKEAVAGADRKLAEACERMGIPAELRPRLSLDWYGRGQSAVESRRAELRKLGMAQIRSITESACCEIDRRTVELMTALIVGGLESADAHAFLDGMPSVEQLMPLFDVRTLNGSTGSSTADWELEGGDDDDFE